MTWFACLVVFADDCGWLDTLATSRPMRFLDERIGPIWRLVYRWGGAEALDRRIVQRSRYRDAVMFLDLAHRLDGVGLSASAGRCRGAAERIASRR